MSILNVYFKSYLVIILVVSGETSIVSYQGQNASNHEESVLWFLLLIHTLI